MILGEDDNGEARIMFSLEVGVVQNQEGEEGDLEQLVDRHPPEAVHTDIPIRKIAPMRYLVPQNLAKRKRNVLGRQK